MASEVEQNSIPHYSSIVHRIQESVNKARAAEQAYLLGEGRMLLERHLARILNASIGATAKACLDTGSQSFSLKLQIASIEDAIRQAEAQTATLKVKRPVAIRQAIQVVLIESGYPIEGGQVVFNFSLDDQGSLIQDHPEPEDPEEGSGQEDSA
jgi:hypothetical protein